MMNKSFDKKSFNLEQLAYTFCLVGIVIFAIGVVNYFTKGPTASASKNNIVKTDLTERDLAIAQAIKNGDKVYTYTSSFIPGIGKIANPEEYKAQWQENAQKEVNK